MKKFLLVLLIVLLNIKCSSAQSDSPWPQQMSAEQIINMPNGKVVTNKIYIDHGKTRFDMNVAGMQMTTIMRLDKRTIYTIVPARKMVVETPMMAKDEESVKAFDPTNLKFDPMGSGTVDGIECDKYKLNYATGRNQIFWINKQTRVPVQMEAEDGSMKVKWANVIPGPQPDSLFEPPADYTLTKATPGGTQPH